jgi:hypothetical protein
VDVTGQEYGDAFAAGACIGALVTAGAVGVAVAWDDLRTGFADLWRALGSLLRPRIELPKWTQRWIGRFRR